MDRRVLNGCAWLVALRLALAFAVVRHPDKSEYNPIAKLSRIRGGPTRCWHQFNFHVSGETGSRSDRPERASGTMHRLSLHSAGLCLGLSLCESDPFVLQRRPGRAEPSGEGLDGIRLEYDPLVL